MQRMRRSARAFTQACTYPDGTKVSCAAMLDIEGGKIGRQTAVQATKGFARFARSERISEAVRRAERGLVDADLGGGVVKQRVARPGQGRSGGYRVLIAYRAKARAVFLFGFAKSAQANIGDDELATLREIASGWFKADEAALARALAQGAIQEVDDEEE
jgi:hypothetical protein